jgi:hypothetical protein
MIKKLKDNGMYDKSLVVIVADHGVAFHNGQNRRKLLPSNIEDLGPVPLFFKLPGGKDGGKIDDRLVENIDVVPTIADALNVELPYKPDGRSALSPAGNRATTEMRSRTGKLIKVPRAEFERRQRAALARKIALFGDGSLDRLYRIGPNPELIGRPARANAPAGAVKAKINGAGDLADVDPGSDFLPAHITGSLSGGSAGATRHVVVAVNGVIRASGETFYLEGSKTESLSVMVPDSALRPGKNRVEVFEVTGSGRSARLVPLGRTG